MTISVDVEFDNSNLATFGDLEKNIFQMAMKFGQKVFQRVLEERDTELRDTRDKERYTNKGKRKTCLKTLLGDVEFERTVYRDNTITDGIRHVFLLDDDIGLESVGHVSSGVCEVIANTICETTYRGTAKALAETTGLVLSHQGVWDIAQQLGESRTERIARLSELARAKKGAGIVKTKILFEEDDGIWLAMQGKDRKEYGPSKEMKIGIAYDGALWSGGKNGKARRTLDNKVAFASFEPAEVYREHKEGIVASLYDVKGIELRIQNGDGAGWVQGFGKADINVLDPFHRNKALLQHVQHSGLRKLLLEQIYKTKDVTMLLACLEAMINDEEDPDVVDHYRKLQTYFEGNKECLLSPYDRNVKIPETREPGVVHHARVGVMESNVFTIVGNRMKGRRACWSVRGATNLANLLCLYHTTGFKGMFSGAELPAEEVISLPKEKPLSASKTPLKVGHGFESHCRSTLPALPWLKRMTGYKSLAEMTLR